jgi:flagellum-specific peptidoglycan hydrolase FlgJ|uniref:Muramidase (Flagellum-specific) n=1 Tax=Podoviridae sp. ctKzN3 TaxID=2826553 RepID=A0A8S5NGU8_9CAUD|nr:MAG TPA: Muramidase (flagellum-specific) [Podoviridae sp. ctKzN3]
MTNSEFIEQIATYVKKYAYVYGIEVHSPIIAQAILESGWGKSSLASKYHNYFGLKCGSAWKGKSVNMATQEEYTVGVMTDIRDNFRVFDSMEDGVKGYFDFINYSRYANLKGVKDTEEYCRRIKADGYATSSKYVDSLLRVIRDNNLTRFDNNEPIKEEPKKEDGDNMRKEELTGDILSGKEIIDILAKRVIKGDYGNGRERQNKLGDLYSIVQKRVNELC